MPTGEMDAEKHGLRLARSPKSLITLLHLSAASVHRGKAAMAATDSQAALVQAERLVRLGTFTAGLDDVPGLSAAHEMRNLGWKLGLAAITANPRDDEQRRAITDLLAGTPPLPSAERAIAILRLLTLHQAIDLDHAIRDGTGARKLRNNRPPDVNEALRLLNDWYDAIGRALPGILDTPGLARAGTGLPMPAKFGDLDASPKRPLANRMLFAEPVAKRRRESARMVARACSMNAWLSLLSLVTHATHELQARQVLAAILAVPMGSDSESYARDLRQALGLSGEADERLLVQVDGSAVLVKDVPKSRPPGSADSTSAKPESPPLVRIDFASPP